MDNTRIDEFGTKYWYNKEGQYHCVDGPAVIYKCGDKFWYLNGKRHRENGPAIELNNGDKYWYLNGKLHRENGPVVERANGIKEHWINDVRYSSLDAGLMNEALQ